MARRQAEHPAFAVLKDWRKTPAAKTKAASSQTEKKRSSAGLPSAESPSAGPRPEERAVFRAAMALAGVMPLPPSDRAEVAPPRPSPRARQRKREQAEVLAESLGGPLSVDDGLDLAAADEQAEGVFARSGLSRRALQDLRRGRWAIQSELDLHGYDREGARAALARFLELATRRGQRCVRIVHGKGLSSPGGVSVLKILSRQWLSRRAEVLAFCSALPRDGGEGALLVLLASGSGIK